MCGTFVRICESTLLVDQDSRPLESERPTVGDASHGDEHAVERRLLGVGCERLSVRVEQARAQAVWIGLERPHARAQVDRLVALGDAPAQGLHQVWIAAGDQLLGELDHRHARAERVVGGRELQADDAAADHQQSAGDLDELQRIGRVHHPRVLVGDARQLDRARAGREDRVIEGHRRPVHRQRVGVHQLADALQHAHLAPLGESRESCREPADDSPLPLAERVQIDLGVGEGHAAGAGALGLGDHLGDVQQRLGGDAADVQADAAERLVALDEHDVEAEVRCAEGRRVAAWPGSEDHQLRVAHSSSLRMSASRLARCAQKRAALAPSITRWS
jgi:hypothetical protein